jgi:hypothetical protein
MPAAAPLILTADVTRRLHRLRVFAAKRPVDVLALQEALKTDEGSRAHGKKMTAQSIAIPGPWPFFVTLSLEVGHPCGTCRHMSMSVVRDGRVPHPAAVWMVARELGFSGELQSCNVWPEQLSDGGTAINVAQPVSVQQEASA